jgi:hypothetical protein
MIVGNIAQSLFLAADLIFRRHCSIAQPDYKNGKQRIYTLLAEKSARELLRSRTGEWRSRNSSNFSADYRPSHGEKKSLHNNDIWLAEGAVTSEPVSTLQFPGNSEKYREFCRISAIEVSAMCACVENSKTWQPNSLRRITGKSQRASGMDRAGSSVQPFSGRER